MSNKKIYNRNLVSIWKCGEHYRVNKLTTQFSKPFEERVYTQKGKARNARKLENNRKRTRSNILAIAECNDWDLYVTFTLDPQKYDRWDLKQWKKELSQWLRNYKKKHGCDVKYLLIPELHKDEKSWHMHGLIMGLPKEHLTPFAYSQKTPKKIRDLLEQGRQIYYWEAYQAKFGFCSVEYMENKDATSLYITKYIAKNALSSVKELNARSFYASQGLNRPELTVKGEPSGYANEDDKLFENDHMTAFQTPILDEALKYVHVDGLVE